jgi:ribulose-phosphate 3-epimerase
VADVVAEIDLWLIMSVEPGFGGQSFIPSSFDKIEGARAWLDRIRSSAELEVDGGVDAGNAQAVVSAGASVLVAGSAVYRHPGGPGAGIAAIRGAFPPA